VYCEAASSHARCPASSTTYRLCGSFSRGVAHSRLERSDRSVGHHQRWRLNLRKERLEFGRSVTLPVRTDSPSSVGLRRRAEISDDCAGCKLCRVVQVILDAQGTIDCCEATGGRWMMSLADACRHSARTATSTDNEAFKEVGLAEAGIATQGAGHRARRRGSLSPSTSQQSMVPWASRITWTTRHNLHPAQSSLISARRPQADASKGESVRTGICDRSTGTRAAPCEDSNASAGDDRTERSDRSSREWATPLREAPAQSIRGA